MATKKIPIDKPLTPRLEAEFKAYTSLLAGLATQVLNAKDGEVYRAVVKEAVHATDVFFAERVGGAA